MGGGTNYLDVAFKRDAHLRPRATRRSMVNPFWKGHSRKQLKKHIMEPEGRFEKSIQEMALRTTRHGLRSLLLVRSEPCKRSPDPARPSDAQATLDEVTLYLAKCCSPATPGSKRAFAGLAASPASRNKLRPDI